MSSGATTVLFKKRERTQNWVPEEKSALFALIKMHASAIENKKIDAAASAMKALAWQRIHCAFRGRFSTERDITRMREQWRRMKAQARVEMYTFAEKVKTLGPDEAAKCRPSNLSIEVWRLMEGARKTDCEADRSDESSQDVNETSTSIHAILDKLTPTTSEITIHDIKLEANSNSDCSGDDSNQNEIPSEKSDGSRKRRSRSCEDQPMNLTEQKTPRLDDISRFANDENKDDRRDESVTASKDGEEPISDRNESIERTRWDLEAARREHEVKLRTLNIDLERAEIQKQTAINELKASETKRQMIESQAAEYYSQIRMIGERGSGAGKGGGGGGAIREAGGAFGQMEAAHEDQYFYNQQKEQLQKLREGLRDEISFHEEQIKRHQEAINRHKKRIMDMHHE